MTDLLQQVFPDFVSSTSISVEVASQRIALELERVGRDAPIAVLPEGPMTIPYLTDSVEFSRAQIESIHSLPER